MSETLEERLRRLANENDILCQIYPRDVVELLNNLQDLLWQASFYVNGQNEELYKKIDMVI